MYPYQHEFIQLAIDNHVLTFGNFTLKSGRKSPYFFNTGLFYYSAALEKLGELYAEIILNSSISFDILFGPAYKGIPLVTATGIALAKRGKNYPIAFNRKEAKDHGEGGCLVGAPLKHKRILILDDVITAGTAFYESKKLIESQEASVIGMVIALDREEKGINGTQPALQEIREKEKIPVTSLIAFNDIINYLQEHAFDKDILQTLQEHQKSC